MGCAYCEAHGRHPDEVHSGHPVVQVALLARPYVGSGIDDKLAERASERRLQLPPHGRRRHQLIRKPSSSTRLMKIKSSAARRSGKPPIVDQTRRRSSIEAMNGPRIRPPGRSCFVAG